MLHRHWLRSLGLRGSYEFQDVAPADLPRFIAGLRDNGFAGGNITVPHKVAAMPLLTRVDATAQAIGAVNTIWFEGDALVGANTDVAGFLANLDDRAPGWDLGGRDAVILGAGGAARAAAFGLLQRGFRAHLVNRTFGTAEALARQFGGGATAHSMQALPDLMSQASLLVNTTSLGMLAKPDLNLDLAPLPRHAVVCDVVYVPLQTRLLHDADVRGHRVVDGLGMLLHQAVAGFARWFGATPVVTEELRSMVAADIAVES